jgi:Lon protease-like protein
MDHIIPLFPLQLVVFPSSRYPLHIFETRYKNMIGYCLKNDKGFGIIAKIDTDISNIGCYVKISSILKKYDNGEYDIIVEGINRFSIDKIDVHEEGYFTAEIKEYNDISAAADAQLIDDIKGKFEDLLKKINLELDENFWNNFIKSDAKSFKIAEKAGLSIPEQQKLLAMQNENDRLTFLRDHFANLDEQLEKNLADKTVILNDGFIN